MTLNHNRIRQVLQGIIIVTFSISVLFQLRNLYIYGGKPPKSTVDSSDEDEDEVDNDDTRDSAEPRTGTINNQSEAQHYASKEITRKR